MPNASGTAISLRGSSDTRDGSGYIIVGASWVDRHESSEGARLARTGLRIPVPNDYDRHS